MEFPSHITVSPETHEASIVQLATVASDTAQHNLLQHQQCCEFQPQSHQHLDLDLESVPRRDYQQQNRLELQQRQLSNNDLSDLHEDCRNLKRSMGAREGRSTPGAGPLKKPRVEHQQQQSPSAPLKTDTASVLLEAIGYIKFLQEQVQVLSTPYMKHSNPHDDLSKMGQSNVRNENARQDLRSKGLCLVPVSCTLQVANDNGADLWTPAVGGGCR